jgi:hypothetical protein
MLRPVGGETTVCPYIWMEPSHGEYTSNNHLVLSDGEHRSLKAGNNRQQGSNQVVFDCEVHVEKYRFRLGLMC